GQLVHDEVVEVVSGENTRVVIPRTKAASDVGTQSAITELQRLVTLQEAAVEKTKRQTEAGVAPAAELTAAQIELIEARVRLAEALRKLQDIDRLLRELVEKREEQWRQAKALLAAAAIPQAE